MWVLKNKTIKTEQKLKSLGLKYQEIWEHDFEKLKKTCNGLKGYLENHEVVSRLNPRNSFLGRRTHAKRLFMKKGSKIYIDFTSISICE